MIAFVLFDFYFFFFKQKTAYEMRISDWSSDVCSSDLPFRPYDRLLVATDFSPSARVALETCISFFPAASITLFHAYVVPFAGYLGRSEVEREFETYGV